MSGEVIVKCKVNGTFNAGGMMGICGKIAVNGSQRCGAEKGTCEYQITEEVKTDDAV